MPPDPPVNFEANRVGQNFVDLQWSTPLSDGGSAITEYVVQKSSSKKDDWTKVASLSSYQTYCRASNLSENTDYYFSVEAVNKVGKSEPCEMKNAVTTQKGLRKYYTFLINYVF